MSSNVRNIILICVGLILVIAAVVTVIVIYTRPAKQAATSSTNKSENDPFQFLCPTRLPIYTYSNLPLTSPQHFVSSVTQLQESSTVTLIPLEIPVMLCASTIDPNMFPLYELECPFVKLNGFPDDFIATTFDISPTAMRGQYLYKSKSNASAIGYAFPQVNYVPQKTLLPFSVYETTVDVVTEGGQGNVIPNVTIGILYASAESQIVVSFNSLTITMYQVNLVSFVEGKTGQLGNNSVSLFFLPANEST